MGNLPPPPPPPPTHLKTSPRSPAFSDLFGDAPTGGLALDAALDAELALLGDGGALLSAALDAAAPPGYGALF
jgi:hypothetical protein